MSVFTKNKNEDFMAWYLEIVRRSQIVDTRTDVKGCNVLMANGYDIWERMKNILDQKFLDTNHKNMYFPLLIPEHFLTAESEHFEGFVPEVGWVTQVGDKPLEEKYALRPTSETIMYHMYSQWVRAYTDLPLKVNQWCNIIRIDTKDTKPLLRDREFQWTEVHTAHETPEEAENQVKESMDIYGSFFDECCLPYFVFKRPKHDTFPGADYSVAYDCTLPDGKTLQIGTTHNLSQGFSKVFDIRFQKADGSHDHVYQTCYGLSTRVIAAVIGVHGDNNGLVLPPYLAPTQVVIIPIIFKGKEELVDEGAKEILQLIKDSGLRVRYDNSDKTAGWKFNEYELLGVPIRVEVGPRDIKKGGAMLIRRDTRDKTFVEKDKIVSTITSLFNEITLNLQANAKDLLDHSLSESTTWDELTKIFNRDKPGVVRTNWCGDIVCSDKIKDGLKANILGTKYDEKEEPFAPCSVCQEEAKYVVYIAKTY